MKIHTSRFAAIEIEPDDILFFRNGLLGFEDCRHWVLLADADNAAVAWLQSMQHADIAVPVVSPRRFAADYQVHLEPADVDSLQLITVGIGLDDWEWGVTLWATNPKYLKDIVYEMRFDEASAKYAEFGPFYTSYIASPQQVLEICRV